MIIKKLDMLIKRATLRDFTRLKPMPLTRPARYVHHFMHVKSDFFLYHTQVLLNMVIPQKLTIYPTSCHDDIHVLIDLTLIKTFRIVLKKESEV